MPVILALGGLRHRIVSWRASLGYMSPHFKIKQETNNIDRAAQKFNSLGKYKGARLGSTDE